MQEQATENIDPILFGVLTGEGYLNLKRVAGRGVCGLRRFIYTIGICYGIDETGFHGRYCFKHAADADEALEAWTDGTQDPGGNWMRHKGYYEYSNPNYEQD